MASTSTLQRQSRPMSAAAELMSSPDSFSFMSNLDFGTHHTGNTGRTRSGGDPWAASGDFDMPSFNEDFKLDTSFFDTIQARPVTQPESSPLEAPKAAPSAESKISRKSSTARIRKSFMIDRPRSWLIPGTRSAKAALGSVVEDRSKPAAETLSRPDNSSEKAAPTPEDHIQNSKEGSSHQPSSRPLERSQSASESFASFARRSWIGSSRSPSPKNSLEHPAEAAKATPGGADQDKLIAATPMVDSTPAPPQRQQIVTQMDRAEQTQTAEQLKPAPTAFTRASNYLSKMKAKQQTTVSEARESTESDQSCSSLATSLENRNSNSMQTSASQSICSDGNTNTPITDDSCNETLPQVRDPLFASLKTLDAEVKDFSSKQTAQRVGLVQSILLPFLRSTRDHPSIREIGLEDVERRAICFNKWWVSLLDMLHGQAQQPIPGMDRPILLEAATMLMMRPEWRRATSYMQPLAERSPAERVRSRSWTTGSQSTDHSAHSQMLAESAEHNIRTMFVANLVRQMAYVVDKMSMRHAPLSLVNFSGKTCAYAFFFAPGVADILVRLWGLTPELIRRAGVEFRLPRRDTGESDDIVALFPPKLAILGWSSPRGVWDSLKRIPKMTLLVARIPWTGPWVARWKGRDTDLFFIFCKYFHILSDQFMPPGLPLTEKARSPAFVLVHSQLLSIFDSTIHRQSAMDQMYGSPMVDSFSSVDATALSMPLPPTNLMKGMGENRLVILLKDFLTDDASGIDHAKHTFAESFAALMKGSASQTSLFNNAACFTLCDFLEEVLVIYHDLETASTSYIDWAFWVDVCKKMASSMNTMSEVRMLSFLFTIWEVVATDHRRKKMVCLDWLLTEEAFNTFFNNWCPMVRAYYQRLVCWRMCRYLGDSSEIDMDIFLAAAARLKTNWAHYLYLRQNAQEAGRAVPSTAPMSPAMGKKFMIIRQEINTPQPGLFMGFDTFARASPSDLHFPEADLQETNALGRGDSKKRWSLLGRVLSMTSGNSLGPSPTEEYYKNSPISPNTDTAAFRRELADAASLAAAAQPPSKSSGTLTKSSSTDVESVGSSSPAYDEQQKYIFRFILGWQQNPGPARERVLNRPRLPMSTQNRIDAKNRILRQDSSSGTGTPTPRASAAQSPLEAPRSQLNPQRGDLNSVSSSVQEWLKNTPAGGQSLPNTDRRRQALPKLQTGPVPVAGTRSRTDSPVDGPPSKDNFTQPIQPAGMFARNAVYCGRALAEWSQVVSECNIFTERRMDEGIQRLCDVEVPLLGVEGFRKVGA